MSECLYTPKEIEEELNEKAHMLNVARYIHDEFYDVWRHAEKELEVPSAEARTQMSLADCISRQDAIDAIEKDAYRHTYLDQIIEVIKNLPSAQPETARRIVGKSRNGMTLWYQCDMCNEPVDAQDNFCRGCGRRLTDG